MDLIGRLKPLMRDLDGAWVVSFTTRSDPRELFDKLKDADVKVSLKKYSRHRSLDANAMAWALIDQIAEESGKTKTEVYRNAIRDIGGVSDTVCVIEKAVDKLCEGWSQHGLGWQTEVMESKIAGCKNVTLYYGSSVYDTRQMGALIDSLIQDAEGLGIPTMTEKEAEKLIGKWEKKENRKNDQYADGKGYPEDGSGVSEEEHEQLPETQQDEGQHVRE